MEFYQTKQISKWISIQSLILIFLRWTRTQIARISPLTETRTWIRKEVKISIRQISIRQILIRRNFSVKIRSTHQTMTKRRYGLYKLALGQPIANVLLAFKLWQIGVLTRGSSSRLIPKLCNLSQVKVESYIDGCRSVDRINCSLVTPVSWQTQSDGY